MTPLYVDSNMETLYTGTYVSYLNKAIAPHSNSTVTKRNELNSNRRMFGSHPIHFLSMLSTLKLL